MLFRSEDTLKLKVRWARIKKLIGNSSDGPTESLLEPVETTEGSSWDRAVPVTLGNKQGGTPGATALGKGTRGEPSTGAATLASERFERSSVDEVVVDRTWYASDHDSPSSAISEPAGSPEKSGSNPQGTSTDRESVTGHSDQCWGIPTILTFIRWRLVPWLFVFFSPRDFDPKAEAQYVKEVWYTSKVRFMGY